MHELKAAEANQSQNRVGAPIFDSILDNSECELFLQPHSHYIKKMNSEFDKSHQLYQKGKNALDQSKLEEAINYFKECNALYPHFKTLEL